MKKLLLFLLLSVASFAQTTQWYSYQQVLSLNAVGADSGVKIQGSGANYHKLVWTTSGTVSTCSVRVDSSADGTSWNTGDVIAAQTCTSNGTFISTSIAVNYVRINLVTLTGGGSLTFNLSGYINNPSGAASTPTQLHAWCSGTIGTASATAYILNPAIGNGSTANVCTVATGQIELPMPYACTVSNLFAKAGANGAVAGSGVVTVYKNTVATAVTCTLGTGVTCSDTTHSVAFAAGDTWSVRVTTGQATDTTASIKAAFQCL